MPMFVIISGFFSKNLDRVRENSFSKLFLPYLFLNAVASMLITKNFFVNPLIPQYGYWYLLCLYLWRISAKDIAIRGKKMILFSIIVALIAGKIEFSAISMRLFSMLPFFLIGYFLDDNAFIKLKSLPKLVGYIVVIMCLTGVACAAIFDLFPIEVFYYRDTYSSLNLSIFWGIWFRFISIGIALLMSAGILVILPERRLILTKVGINSMCVYCLHPYLVTIMNYTMISFGLIHSEIRYSYLLIYFGCAIIILSLLNLHFVTKYFNRYIERLGRVMII